jgi:hypothetical protein
MLLGECLGLIIDSSLGIGLSWSVGRFMIEGRSFLVEGDTVYSSSGPARLGERGGRWTRQIVHEREDVRTPRRAATKGSESSESVVQ